MFAHRAKRGIQACDTWRFSKAWMPGSAYGRPGMTAGQKKSLERKRAARSAALRNPMPIVCSLARTLRSDMIVLKPIVPRTLPKVSERDCWGERMSAAEEARFALGAFWRLRRHSSLIGRHLR